MESSEHFDAGHVPAEYVPAEDGVRLQKLMAAAGVASRRGVG